MRATAKGRTGEWPVTAQAAWPGLLEPAIGYALAVVQAITPDLLPQPTPCAGWDVRMLLRHASESLAALHEGIDAGRVSLRPPDDPAGDPAGDPAQVFRDRVGRLHTTWAGAARTSTTPAGTTPTGGTRTGSAGTSTGGPSPSTTSTGGPSSPATSTGGPSSPATSTGSPSPPTTGTTRVGASPPGADAGEVVTIADRQLTLGVLIGVGALELAVHGWDLFRACGRREPIPSALATSLLEISPLLVPDTGRHPLFGPPVTVPSLAIPSDQLVAYLGRNPR